MHIINVTHSTELHNDTNNLIEYATAIAKRSKMNFATFENLQAFLIITVKDRRFVVLSENEKTAEHYFLSKVKTSDLSQIDDIIFLD